MPVLTATLIQDLSEFRVLVDPLIAAACEQAQPREPWHPGEEQVLLWLIREELEECYGLFDAYHIHNEPCGLYARDYVRRQMPQYISLSQWLCFWIKAPKIYADYNQVAVSIKNQDLFIEYHSPNLNLPFNQDYINQNQSWIPTLSPPRS